MLEDPSQDVGLAGMTYLFVLFRKRPVTSAMCVLTDPLLAASLCLQHPLPQAPLTVLQGALFISRCYCVGCLHGALGL